MTDIASKVGQALAEKTLNSAQSQKLDTALAGPNFERLLTEHLDKQTEMSRKIVDSLGMGSDANKVQSISAEGLEIKPGQIASNIDTGVDHGKVMGFLSEVNRGALQMDNLIEMVNSGTKLNPSELLAMQASMSSNMHIIDIASKAVEQANTGVKHLLNTSVQ